MKINPPKCPLHLWKIVSSSSHQRKNFILYEVIKLYRRNLKCSPKLACKYLQRLLLYRKLSIHVPNIFRFFLAYSFFFLSFLEACWFPVVYFGFLFLPLRAFHCFSLFLSRWPKHHFENTFQVENMNKK